MSEELGALDSLIQQKIDNDVDFQTSLEQLEEEDRVFALQTKRAELANLTFAEMQEKARKDAELAENYKVRAEKAEKGKTKPQESKEQDLSTKDLYSLMQAKVAEEDVDDVVKSAKLLNKTIPEALKDPVVQAILKQNEDYRKTAQAQNTGKSKAGIKTVTSDEIVKNANEGKFPERGSKEAEELFWARRGGRRD